MAFATIFAVGDLDEDDIVTILVLLEWPLQQLLTRGRNSYTSVTILVLLEWPLQRKFIIMNKSSTYVTILVLLEWPLQHVLLRTLLTVLNGYNPCFIGMAFATVHSVHRGR